MLAERRGTCLCDVPYIVVHGRLGILFVVLWLTTNSNHNYNVDTIQSCTRFLDYVNTKELVLWVGGARGTQCIHTSTMSALCPPSFCFSYHTSVSLCHH